jgi:hypothetical protein
MGRASLYFLPMELVPDSLLAITALLYIAILTVLIRRYFATRDVSLVWVGAGAFRCCWSPCSTFTEQTP